MKGKEKEEGEGDIVVQFQVIVQMTDTDVGEEIQETIVMTLIMIEEGITEGGEEMIVRILIGEEEGQGDLIDIFLRKEMKSDLEVIRKTGEVQVIVTEEIEVLEKIGIGEEAHTLLLSHQEKVLFHQGAVLIYQLKDLEDPVALPVPLLAIIQENIRPTQIDLIYQQEVLICIFKRRLNNSEGHKDNYQGHLDQNN